MDNIKVAVIGGRGDGRFSPIKRASALEGLIAAETGNKTAEEYDRCVGVLFRCIRIIADAVATLPRQIENVATGQVIAQANFPQPELGENGRPLSEDELPILLPLNELLYQTTIALHLCSRAYWHKERNLVVSTGVVWQDPALMSPKYDDDGKLIRFEKRIPNRVPQPVPIEDICYIFLPGTKDNEPDTPPAKVSMEAAGLVYHQNAFLKTFFEQGAMPTTVVVAEDDPPPHEKKRIRDYLMRLFSGRLRAWGLEVLSAKLRFEKLVPPLKEVFLPEIKTQGEYEICVTMGVPISILYSQAARNSTAEQDDQHLYTKKVIPFCQKIEEKVNKDLFAPMGLRLRFRPDKHPLFEALATKNVKDLELILDYLSPNEVRAAAGYLPDPSLNGMEPAIVRKSKRGMGQLSVPGTQDSVDSEQLAVDSEQSAVSSEEVKALPFGMSQGEYEGMLGDLRKWESKCLKRLPDMPPMAVPFESDAIPAPITYLVKKQLLRAKTKEEIKAAFAAPFQRTTAVLPNRVLHY